MKEQLIATGGGWWPSADLRTLDSGEEAVAAERPLSGPPTVARTKTNATVKGAQHAGKEQREREREKRRAPKRRSKPFCSDFEFCSEIISL